MAFISLSREWKGTALSRAKAIWWMRFFYHQKPFEGFQQEEVLLWSNKAECARRLALWALLIKTLKRGPVWGSDYRSTAGRAGRLMPSHEITQTSLQGGRALHFNWAAPRSQLRLHRRAWPWRITCDGRGILRVESEHAIEIFYFFHLFFYFYSSRRGPQWRLEW